MSSNQVYSNLSNNQSYFSSVVVPLNFSGPWASPSLLNVLCTNIGGSIKVTIPIMLDTCVFANYATSDPLPEIWRPRGPIQQICIITDMDNSTIGIWTINANGIMTIAMPFLQPFTVGGGCGWPNILSNSYNI